MNICFLEGDMSRRGGTERMTSILANALCEKNNITVISLRLKENTLFFQLDSRVVLISLENSSNDISIINEIRFVRKIIKENCVDCLINVDTGIGYYGILASVGLKTKVITWEHGNYYNNWGSRWFPLFRRFAAKHSDAMVVLTQKDKENYLTHIKTKKPIYVIPNPVERHSFTYDDSSKTIISAGLLLPIKGYDMAIEAASVVLPKHPDWKWIVYGEGPEREYLERLIREHGLEKQFLLPGSVSDMDTAYKNAAFFVMTSKMEGLPMVLLEAKSWGLPLVSFDIMTGPSDIIRDGVNGYLVQQNNTSKLAEKIETLIVDKSLRCSLSGNSQLDIDRFVLGSIGEFWGEVFK